MPEPRWQKFYDEELAQRVLDAAERSARAALKEAEAPQGCVAVCILICEDREDDLAPSLFAVCGPQERSNAVSSTCCQAAWKTCRAPERTLATLPLVARSS